MFLFLCFYSTFDDEFHAISFGAIKWRKIYIVRFIYDDIVYKFKADQIKLSFQRTQAELRIHIFFYCAKQFVETASERERERTRNKYETENFHGDVCNFYLYTYSSFVPLNSQHVLNARTHKFPLNVLVCTLYVVHAQINTNAEFTDVHKKNDDDDTTVTAVWQAQFFFLLKLQYFSIQFNRGMQKLSPSQMSSLNPTNSKNFLFLISILSVAFTSFRSDFVLFYYIPLYAPLCLSVSSSTSGDFPMQYVHRLQHTEQLKNANQTLWYGTRAWAWVEMCECKCVCRESLFISLAQ